MKRLALAAFFALALAGTARAQNAAPSTATINAQGANVTVDGAQDGPGHTATVDQTGAANDADLAQTGADNEADVSVSLTQSERAAPHHNGT